MSLSSASLVIIDNQQGGSGSRDHKEDISCMSCPSDVGALDHVQDEITCQFVSQESVHDSDEAHSKSLLVSGSYKCDPSVTNRLQSASFNLPHSSLTVSKHSTKSPPHHNPSLPLPAPILDFVPKNTTSTAGPQISAAQCNHGESVQPSMDYGFLSTLPNRLNLTSANNTEQITTCTTTSPSSAMEGPLDPEQNRLKRESPLRRQLKCLISRQASQNSQCSIGTLKASSSCQTSSASSSSSELSSSPNSSPRISSQKENARCQVSVKPIACTEGSLHLVEHKPVSDNWQNLSLESRKSGTLDLQVHGVNCFVAVQGNEETCRVTLLAGTVLS